LHSRQHGRLSRLFTASSIGLPFAGSEPVSLATPFAAHILHATFHEMNRRGVLPQLSGIHRAVLLASEALGAPSTLAKELADYLGPKLLQAFENEAINQTLELEPEKFPDIFDGAEKLVWIDSLDGNGNYLPGEKPVKSSTVDIPKSGFQIIIDERKQSWFLTSKEEVTRYLGQSPNHLSIMFLVMTHVGKNIDDHICFSTFGLTKKNRTNLHNTVRHFRAFVGPELGTTMIQKCHKHGYPYCVPVAGWSFWWLRIGEKRDLSRWLL